MTAQDPGDDLRRSAVRSVGWVVLDRWSSRLLTFGVFLVLSRVVAPEQFGLISLATVFTAILQVFVDSGFSRALVQRKELGAKDASTVFWTAVGISLVLYALAFLCAPLAAKALDEPELTALIQVLAFGLPISALSRTPAALLERSFEFKTLAVRQLVGAAAGAALAVPVGLLGWGAWALVAQTLGTAFVSVITLWATTTWRPRFEFSWASLRDMAPISLSALGMDLLDAVQQNIDKLILGAFFSAEIVGYYFLAQRLGTIIVELVTTVIARISLTTFSRVQDDLPRLSRVFQQLTFASGAIGFPIFGFVAAFAPQLVPFLFGSGWDPVIGILWILAPSWALASAMYFDRNVLLAVGRARTAFGLSALQNATAIGLVFALAPLGVAGVAFSRWARIVTWPLRLVVLHRAIGLPLWSYTLQVLRPLLAVALPVGGILFLQTTGWARAPLPILSFVLPAGILALVASLSIMWASAGAANRSALRRAVGDLRGRRS